MVGQAGVRGRAPALDALIGQNIRFQVRNAMVAAISHEAADFAEFTLSKVEGLRPNRLTAFGDVGKPVDWYPWGPEAFEKARKENKPIFLSIGYSTCHWCHVMECESFEDPEVARPKNLSLPPLIFQKRPGLDG